MQLFGNEGSELELVPSKSAGNFLFSVQRIGPLPESAGQYSHADGEGRGGPPSLAPHLFLKPSNNNRNISQLLPS